MGKSDDTTDKEYGMYPLVMVDEITKEDLLRCKRDKIIIINLIDCTYFDIDNNKWADLKQYNKYSDQWKKH